ncbi:DAK2 domain-containing protein [Dactylosporangium sp. NPDC051484]|uniref:DAK2 domain-containing protein n=1 Tax=Dactylosporangium sp. NPDC051484 TaxID=3154942 RepID=UPI00344E4667
MPDSVDAATVRRWCAAGLDALRRHRAEIDALNVYPVPDGDTGTNLALTMAAAAEAADGATVGDVLRGAARGALLGARGNSGIILAQLFKGLADALDGVVAADAGQLARALDEAARGAYRAVAAPVEGTVLSVGAAAARAALAVAPVAGAWPGGVAAVARAAADGARVALARTPEQLPALAQAGVVDAGGRGLVVLLDALVQTLTGEAPPPGGAPGPATPPDPRPGGTMQREAGSEEYAYEVQYLLHANAAAVEALRGVLAGLGDSLVVIGDEPTWHVHVHVNDIGAAIEAGVEAGRPSRISVTRFADQIAARAEVQRPRAAAAVPSPSAPPEVRARLGVEAEVRARLGVEAEVRAEAGARAEVRVGVGDTTGVRAGAGETGTAEAERRERGDAEHGERAGVGRQERAVVVVCSGPGLAWLFEAEGAAVLSGSPSTGEILDAIRGTGAGRVVVLPNDPNVLAVAAAAAAEARAMGVSAGVVPTRSPVQALAALAVRDTDRRFEDDVIAMAEAAARCRSAEVTIASREALTVAGRCQPGDILAIVDGEVNLIGQDLSQTACRLLDRMLAGGGELVTLVAGRDAPEGLTAALTAHVEGSWPFVEVQCYEGGQPHYPLLVGVE